MDNRTGHHFVIGISLVKPQTAATMKSPLLRVLLSVLVFQTFSLIYSQESYQSHSLNGDLLSLKTTDASYEFSFVSDFAAKITYKSGLEAAVDDSYSVVRLSTVEARLVETHDALVFHTPRAEIRIEKSPFSLQLSDVDQSTILHQQGGFTANVVGTAVSFLAEPGEAFFGTGSRALPVDRRGYRFSIFNKAEWGYDYPREALNINIPFIISSRGYGLFFDEHKLGSLDLGHDDPDVLSFVSVNDELTVYFIAGGNNDTILREYGKITGFQPIPPRWSLGYIQSKYGYETEVEARSVVNGLKENGFPLDAIILDLQWMGGHLQMGTMDWDRQRFPTAESMLSDFLDIGVKTIVIFEPYITMRTGNWAIADSLELFTKNKNGISYQFPEFWAGNASLLDLTREETIEWWWDIYNDRLQEGVTGLWNDLGEPEMDAPDMAYSNGESGMDLHNVYSLLWAKMLHLKFSTNYPKRRLFHLIRSGYAGMQRFRTFPWSGDVRRTYSGMASQIPIVSGMSLSGVGYMHCDIGGFVGGKKNPELYTRWMQMGTFLPVMRAHGTGIDMEPHLYPEPYRSICREAIQLRYRLLPYHYSLAFLNSVTGRPLMLPLNYFEPSNKALTQNNEQFYWGENILVAPALNPGQTEMNVSFPSGRWIDPDTLIQYEANTQAMVSAPIEKIPYFVRSGSFLPQIAPVDSTSDVRNDGYHIQFFADAEVAQSTFLLYEDDGSLENPLAQEQFLLMLLESETSNHSLTLRLSQSGPGYDSQPTQKHMELEIIGLEHSPSMISIAGTALDASNTISEYQRSMDAYYWDDTRFTLWVKFRWKGEAVEIRALPLPNQ